MVISMPATATDTIMSLPRLPPPGTTYDLEREIGLLAPVVATLQAQLGGGATKDDAAIMGAASEALVLIRRLRGIRGTDAERYDAMQRVMEETGLGELVEATFIGKLRAAVGAAAPVPEALGGKALPLELVVLLQQVWFLPMVLWPHGDPWPKIPPSLNSWALAGAYQDATDDRLRLDLMPGLKAMIVDEQRAVELRIGALSQIILVAFVRTEMSFWRELISLGVVPAALQLLEQQMPPPPAAADAAAAAAGKTDDTLAAASADTDCVFALVTQGCFGLLAGCTMHALKASDTATPAAFAEHCIASGFLAFALRTLRSFAALPSAADTNPLAGMVVAVLQTIVLQEGVADRLLGQHLGDHGSTPRELYGLLEGAIERGSEAPVCLQGVRLHTPQGSQRHRAALRPYRRGRGRGRRRQQRWRRRRRRRHDIR
eukprot:COSAG06_NODE_4020_length_4654_cov_2.838419_4_plen_431_part_00